jgi:hypothetical protein
MAPMCIANAWGWGALQVGRSWQATTVGANARSTRTPLKEVT